MDYVTISLIAALVGLLVVEAVSLARHDPPITSVLKRAGRRLAIVPLGIGVVPGHIWWPWDAVTEWAWVGLIVLGVAQLVADVRRWRAGLLWPKWYPLAALVVGVALGGLLWAGGY